MVGHNADTQMLCDVSRGVSCAAKSLGLLEQGRGLSFPMTFVISHPRTQQNTANIKSEKHFFKSITSPLDKLGAHNKAAGMLQCRAIAKESREPQIISIFKEISCVNRALLMRKLFARMQPQGGCMLTYNIMARNCRYDETIKR